MTAGSAFEGVPRSDIGGVVWPAMPRPDAARRLAILQQLDRTQWWPAEGLRQWQFRQAARLIDHALKTAPFQAKRLRAAGLRPGQALTPETWRQIPLLTRQDIQDAGEAMLSTEVPAAHGRTAKTTTSGSSGTPVTVQRTGLEQLFWESLTLRNHIWQRRDLMGKLAVIRSLPPGTAVYPKGSRGRTWGGGAAAVFPTGPAALLNADTAIADQARWLRPENPDYLLTRPSTLLDLAEHCRAEGLSLPRLRDIGTLGAVLVPRVRAACRAAWDVPVVDMYSAQEVGYIALQCPEHAHYHVQSETCLVEVLDADGRPCAPGGLGRVVVTSLHSFAMPLLRYEIGDYAELGPPCPCGRGLPVLTRIPGRRRNLLRLPSGRRVAPAFVDDWFEGLPVAQFQVIQPARDILRFRIVPHRPFTGAEEDRVRALVSERADPAFRVAFDYVKELPRTPGEKFEDFRCEIETP